MQNKNNKDSIQSLIDSNPCGRCRVAGLPICKCGPGGGGGGSESEKNDASETANKPNKAGAAIQKFDEAKTTFVQSQLLTDRTINYETGLISIESNRLHGNLTLRITPGLSKAEEKMAQEFLKAVKAEFDEFKNKLIEQGVSTENFTATLKDNELSVHIPNPKYYDAFIKHLDSKNLLPISNPERAEKHETTRSAQEGTFNPTPLSTRFERK